MGERPVVGTGVLILRGNKVLMGKRKGAHAGGYWSPPGGHLEYRESFEGCAEREVMEETGLKMKNIRFYYATNNIFENESKHSITIFLIGDYVSGEAANLEPEKCEGWQWFEWDKLPTPLFLPVRILVEKGMNPFKK